MGFSRNLPSGPGKVFERLRCDHPNTFDRWREVREATQEGSVSGQGAASGSAIGLVHLSGRNERDKLMPR